MCATDGVAGRLLVGVASKSMYGIGGVDERLLVGVTMGDADDERLPIDAEERWRDTLDGSGGKQLPLNRQMRPLLDEQ